MNEPHLASQMCYLEMLDQFHCMLFIDVSNLQTKLTLQKHKNKSGDIVCPDSILPPIISFYVQSSRH